MAGAAPLHTVGRRDGRSRVVRGRFAFLLDPPAAALGAVPTAPRAPGERGSSGKCGSSEYRRVAAVASVVAVSTAAQGKHRCTAYVCRPIRSLAETYNRCTTCLCRPTRCPASPSIPWRAFCTSPGQLEGQVVLLLPDCYLIAN